MSSLQDNMAQSGSQPPTPARAGLLRSASLLSFVRLAGGGLLFANQILLAGWMGAEAFGVFSFAWACVAVLAVVAGLGLPATSVRFIAQYLVQGADASRALTGLLRWARRVTLGASLVLAAASILLVRAFFGDSPYALATQLALLAVPVMAWMHLEAAYARAFEWMAFSALAEQVMRPLVLIALGLLLVRTHAGSAGAELFTLACLAAYGLATAGQHLLLRHRLRGRVPADACTADRRRWIGVGWAIWVLNSAQLARMNVDPLLVGLLLEPTDVGVYTAAVRTATLVAFVMTVTSVAAQPRLSALHSGSTPGELGAFFRSARIGSFLATLALGLVLAALGRPVLGLFGPEFVAGYPALLVLVAGHVIAAAFGPLTSMLIMTGRQVAAALVQVGAVALGVTLLILLVPRWGIEGAAVAAAASLVMSQVVSGWVARYPMKNSAPPLN